MAEAATAGARASFGDPPMLVKKAEALVFMQMAASLSQADECLFDLIHPLAESSLQAWMQQELEYRLHIEYLPIGLPQINADLALDHVDFRSQSVAFVTGMAGGEVLQLKHTPVVSLGLEVRENPGACAAQSSEGFGADTILSLGEDYFLDVDDPSSGDYPLSRTGILYRVGSWPAEPRSIKVTYYGGWSASQLSGRSAGAVKLAALKTIRANFFSAKHAAANGGLGPLSGETIGKWSGQYMQSWVMSQFSASVPPDARVDLQPFRNYGRI